MTRLRGHFDGQVVVLDDPPPPQLQPNTAVDVLMLDSRQQVLREWEAFMKSWWSRPLPSSFQPQPRRWKREELYERGGRPLS